MRRPFGHSARARSFATALDETSAAGGDHRADEGLLRLVAALRALPLAPGRPDPAVRTRILRAARHAAAAGPEPTLAAALLALPLRDARPTAATRDVVLAAARAKEAGLPDTTPAARRPMRSRRRTGLMRPALAGALALIIGGTGLGGVAIAAHRAVPGDTFYGLKRATERVQLDLSGSRTSRAQARLGFSAARLDELEKIASPQAGATTQHRIAGLLGDIRFDTRAATAPLVESGTANRIRLWRSTNSGGIRLRALDPHLPASVDADYVQTIALMDTTKAEMARLLGSTAVPPVEGGTTPSDRPTTSVAPGGGETSPGGASSPPTSAAPNSSAPSGAPTHPDSTPNPRLLPSPPSLPALPTIPTLPTLPGPLSSLTTELGHADLRLGTS